jgi:ABC-type sugar transport system ATPase subunit
MNFLPAEARLSDGRLVVVHDAFEVSAPASGAAREATGACWVGVRPEDIHVESGGDGIEASVYVTEPLGGETVVDLRVAGRVVKALVPPTLKLETDQKVFVTLDPKRLHVFAEEGDAILSAAGADLFQVSVRRG